MDDERQFDEALQILGIFVREFDDPQSAQACQLAGQIIGNQQFQNMQGDGLPVSRSAPTDPGKAIANAAIRHAKKKGVKPTQFEMPAFQCVAEYEKCIQTSGYQKLCLAALIISLGRLLIPFANLKLPSGKN
jgi:hypothetical protein